MILGGWRGCLVFLLAATLTISPVFPPRPAPAADRGLPAVPVAMDEVAWRDGSGTWHVGVAPAAAVATFLASRADHRERDCLALALALDTDIEQQFDELFAAYDARVPKFAEWVFDWETSYDRYYDVIRFAGSHLYENLQKGEFGIDTEVIRHRIADDILENFSAIVIYPAETKAALAGLEAEMADRVASQINRIWDDESGRLATFLAVAVTETGTLEQGPDPVLPGEPGKAVLGSLGRMQPAAPFAFQTVLPSVASVFVLDDDLSESMLLRTPRPVLARLLGVAIRIAAGISIWRVARQVAETTDLGVYGYAGGLLLGIAIAVGTAWSVDYGLTLADEVLNRSQYEERIHVLIDRLEAEMEMRWARAMRQTVLPACLGNGAVALNR